MNKLIFKDLNPFLKTNLAIWGVSVTEFQQNYDVVKNREQNILPLQFKKEIPEELVNGDFDIAGKRFVLFTPNLKDLSTSLSQTLTEDFDIQARILAVTKNFNALGQSIF